MYRKEDVKVSHKELDQIVVVFLSDSCLFMYRECSSLNCLVLLVRSWFTPRIPSMMTQKTCVMTDTCLR